MTKKECKDGKCEVNIPDLTKQDDIDKKGTKRIRQNV